MTAQPNWEFITNLGDASPIEHGGYFVYRDTTGVYGFEAELLQEPENGGKKRWTVYRICLDQYKMVEQDDMMYMVPIGYDETWRHPIHQYAPWFKSGLHSVADTHGTTYQELIEAFCSDDGQKRAWAYRCVAEFHGWENFDSDPLTLKRSEVEERYKEIL
jgi:hypothetical protein